MGESRSDQEEMDSTSSNGRDQGMADLRRTLADLDGLLGEKTGEVSPVLPQSTAPRAEPGKVSGKTTAPTAKEATTSDAPAKPSARMLMASSAPAPAASVLPRSLDNRSLQLITRFAAGAVILGLEELVKRGQRWEEEVPREVLTGEGASPREADTYGALLRYWTLGLITSARRSAWSIAVDALAAPGSVAGSIGRTADRVMGFWLLRPVRQPAADAINSVLSRMVAVSESWIAEGRQEEQISRWIASNGIDEIINDVIDMISENPQLAALVRDQLSEQSFGIAASVADTGRRLSSVGDDVAENLVRRLLRRGLRKEIEPVVPKEELSPELMEQIKAVNLRGS
jgi:hypothetical protein